MSFSSAITQGLGRTAMVFVLASLAAGVAHAADDKAAEKAAPAVEDRYVIHGDTAYDKKTNLTWARCSVGRHWSKTKGCTGAGKEFTFDDAQKQATGNWRVPTKDEIESLIDQTRKTQNKKPYIDPVAFPNVDRNQMYWTSTGHDDPALAWLGLFAFGEIEVYARNMTYEVRLVRTGQ